MSSAAMGRVRPHCVQIRLEKRTRMGPQGFLKKYSRKNFRVRVLFRGHGEFAHAGVKMLDYAVVVLKYYNILYAPPLEKLNLIYIPRPPKIFSKRKPYRERIGGLSVLRTPP